VSESQDRTLDCVDCGSLFTFTAGEQAYYQERGFSDPKRCPSCRAARRARRSGSSAYGVSQSQYSTGYGTSDRWGQRERPPRQMHDIVCADCGQPAQVPFKPRSDRPVYCRDCYSKRRTW
jgi:CxxC-x17-CxxC domain-containing protein